MITDLDLPEHKTEQLSHIPSKLLRQAVEDILAVINIKEIKFDMANWCKMADGTCYVCVAGAVILSRLSRNELETDYLDYLEIDERVRKILRALNNYRVGLYASFFFGVGCNGAITRETYQYLHKNAMKLEGSVTKAEMIKFCNNTLEMADYLEAAGL